MTSPDSVVLASSTSSSVTLTWTDRSSFETGFRVERAVVPAFGTPVYQMLTVLPPDAASYTDATLFDTAPRLYRVTALASGEAPGQPSAVLQVRFASETVVLGVLASLAGNVTGGWFTPDGETLYAGTNTDVWTVDARTGGVLARLSGAFQVAAALDDGRVAVVKVPSGSSATVQTYAGQTLVGQVTFEPAGTPECLAVVASTVRVSADGQIAAGLCSAGMEGHLAIWGAGGGPPVRLISVSASSSSLDLARNGARAVVNQGPGGMAGYDLAQGVRLWSRSDAGLQPAVLSPDGTRVLDVSSTSVRLLDAGTGDVRSGPAPAMGGRALSFAPDGQAVAYGSGTTSDVVIARASDLAPTIRLVRTPVRALQLLGGSNAVWFRTQPRYEVVRWNPGLGWEAVPG